MSTICSKIESIDRLWFEPLTAKVTKVEKITMVDNTIIALGSDGKIYTNAVAGRVAYSCNGDEGRLSRLLDGCIKLRVLTAKAVSQHKEDVKNRMEKRNKAWWSKQFKEYADNLGITLTSDQLEAIGE